MPAKRLLRRIAACNERSIAATGDIDPFEAARLLSEALADESDRSDLVLGLAEYLCAALNGSTIQLESWRPVERGRTRKTFVV